MFNVQCSIVNAQTRWVGTWAAAPEYTGHADMPQTTNLTDCSLRQIIRVSLGGEQLRMQLSNEFGSDAVEIKAVYIADAIDSCDIVTKSARYLTFNHKRNVRIEAGTAIFSDPLDYNLKPLQRLAVTIVYGHAPEHATSHRGSRTISYIMRGQSKPKIPFATLERVNHWYNISAIDIASDTSHSIAILGNSITDGRGSTTNAQNRWPDIMASALQGQVGVLNLGIGGNCMVMDGGLSQPGSERFERDILGQRGLGAVVIFQGVNDIGATTVDYDRATQTIIQTYQQLAQKVHQHGYKVYAATITPFEGHDYWSFFHEAMRQTINQWIRECQYFDAVIDFDQLVRDQQNPHRLQSAYSDDWLHLNPRGYEAMGILAADIYQN